jgi:hypothetical protein
VALDVGVYSLVDSLLGRAGSSTYYREVGMRGNGECCEDEDD